MALQKTIIYKGITVTDAYHKVFDPRPYKQDVKNEAGEKIGTEYRMVFDVLLSASSSSDVIHSSREECVYDISENAPNIFKQAYVYLKTLDSFSNAVDV